MRGSIELVKYNGIPAGREERIKLRQRPSPDEAFVGRLLAKAQEIRTQIQAALALLNVDDAADGEWDVIPMIVTPRPCVAAMTPDPAVLFVTSDDLHNVLDGA